MRGAWLLSRYSRVGRRRETHTLQTHPSKPDADSRLEMKQMAMIRAILVMDPGDATPMIQDAGRAQSKVRIARVKPNKAAM